MFRNSHQNNHPVIDALLDVRPLIELTEKLQRLTRTKLWAQILIAMVAGVAIGAVLSPSGYGLLTPTEASVLAGWFALPGQIFLALIQMVVIPLVITSIILGICSSGDPAYLRKLGGRISFFFLAATAAAVVIGIALALAVSPGNYMDRELVQRTVGAPEAAAGPGTTVPTLGSVGVAELPEQLVALIPSDPARAALERSMLQLVLFAILMGVALVSIQGSRAKPLLDLLGSIQEVSMEVVSWAMLLAPVAVFGLLAQLTVQIGFEALLGMSVYVGTVLVGLLLVLALYLVVVWMANGMAPWVFLADIREVMLLAFSTSSSAAVMPLSIQTAQEKLGVRPAVARFVIPIGATVNMGGTALYQVVAVVFLAQVFSIDLPMGALVLIAVTAIGASIGSPSSPGAGIVILATILQSIGVPPGGIALILGVDRILDMSRTSVNVAGDLAACVVMNRWISASELPEPALSNVAKD
jgi:proton glutamate symport protein